MGLAALCGALSLGELAARYPEAGGNYVYLREAYGPALAFLYGWKCLLVMDPGLTAALAMGLGAYAQATVPGLAPKAVALVAIVAVAAANAVGLRLAGAIGQVLAVAKIALLVALVVWGFGSGRGELTNFVPFFERPPSAGPLVPALAGALGDGLLLVRRLVGGGQAGRRGARSRPYAAEGARARGERRDAALRLGERGLPLPGPDRGRRAPTRPSPRSWARRSSARAAAARSRRWWWCS